MPDDDDLTSLDRKLRDARKAEQGPVERYNDTEADNMNNGARAGMELVTSILAGTGLGWALDNWLHTTPWLMILCLFIGLGTGFWSVYKISQGLAVKGGSAALQKAQKTATKPPEFNDDDD